MEGEKKKGLKRLPFHQFPEGLGVGAGREVTVNTYPSGGEETGLGGAGKRAPALTQHATAQSTLLTLLA